MSFARGWLLELLFQGGNHFIDSVEGTGSAASLEIFGRSGKAGVDGAALSRTVIMVGVGELRTINHHLGRAPHPLFPTVLPACFGYAYVMFAASVNRQDLHRLIDQLDEQQFSKAASALESIQHTSLEAILRGIPGLRMPDHWPPQFVEFEPLPVTGGELPSERLIRERR